MKKVERSIGKNDTKVDLKNLLKVEGLKLKSLDHIDLCYQ